MSSIFTVIGGVAGFAIGGPAGASAGASIGAGIDGYNTSRDQADRIEATGAYNATQRANQANFNADSILNTDRINRALDSIGASFDASTVQTMSRLNAFFARETAIYNASLLRDEAEVILEALELDVNQAENQYARILGTTEVGYASSGVRIDIEGDTPNLVMLDIETEKELEIMVMTKNGQNEARKLLNAAARSEFEGNMESARIMFEGDQRANGIRFGSTIRNFGSKINAQTRADTIRYEGGVAANQIRYDANTQALGVRQAGNQALVSGLLQGSKTAYAAYNAETPSG